MALNVLDNGPNVTSVDLIARFVEPVGSSWLITSASPCLRERLLPYTFPLKLGQAFFYPSKLAWLYPTSAKLSSKGNQLRSRILTHPTTR